jgi:hypothetical protein
MSKKPGRMKEIGTASLALAMVALAGCPIHSDGGGDAGAGGSGGLPVLPGVTPNECDQTAGLYCEQTFRCDPDGSKEWYGTIDRCKQVDATVCHEIAQLPGATPATVAKDWAACNRAIGAQSCEDAKYGPPLVACHGSKGTRKNGDTCESGAQCATGYCTFPVDSNGQVTDYSCGVCAVPPGVGATCNSSANWCEDGLICLNDVCLKPGPLGAACDEKTTGCQGQLTCFDGHCSKPHLEGEACSPDRTDCDGLLVCIQNTCSQPLGEGADCDVDTFLCAPGLGCIAGKCAPHLPPGADCTGNDDCETVCDGLPQPDGTIANGHCTQPSTTEANVGEHCTPKIMGSDAGVSIACYFGSYCEPSTMKCTLTKTAGQPCTSKDECYGGLECTAGKCTYPTGSMCK